MTDLELAAALRAALTATPASYPQTRALIFGASRPTIVRSSSLIHEPVAVAPPVHEHQVPAAVEAQVAHILASPSRPGETIELAFRRRERELGDAFAALSPIEAHVLHKRLASPRTTDVLAVQFSRLKLDRRQRLLAFLGDARRRAAMKGAA